MFLAQIAEEAGHFSIGDAIDGVARKLVRRHPHVFTPDGRPLVQGRRVSGVTDKQVKELGITATPHHPETELRAKGALFESQTKRRDPLANHWVVDGNLVTGQNQNAAPMVARELMALLKGSTSVQPVNSTKSAPSSTASGL